MSHHPVHWITCSLSRHWIHIQSQSIVVHRLRHVSHASNAWAARGNLRQMIILHLLHIVHLGVGMWLLLYVILVALFLIWAFTSLLLDACV